MPSERQVIAFMSRRPKNCLKASVKSSFPSCSDFNFVWDWVEAPHLHDDWGRSLIGWKLYSGGESRVAAQSVFYPVAFSTSTCCGEGHKEALDSLSCCQLHTPSDWRKVLVKRWKRPQMDRHTALGEKPSYLLNWKVSHWQIDCDAPWNSSNFQSAISCKFYLRSEFPRQMSIKKCYYRTSSVFWTNLRGMLVNICVNHRDGGQYLAAPIMSQM